MNQQGQIQEIAAFNENSLQELTWAIESSRREFSLILALCNSASLRQRLTQELQASCSVEIREIILEQSVTTLYTTIQAELGNEHPEALIVSGLESVKAIDFMLRGANQIREEFRKNFPFPIVFWVTDEVLQKLIRLAPDFQSWTTTVEFAIPTEDLIQYIQQTADEVFAKVLQVGAGRFLDNAALNLGIGSPRRTELELARVELQNRGVTLDPEIEASLEFVLGRDTRGLEQSRQHYERSLALLPNTNSPLPKLLEQRACLLYCMGLWWRTYAVLNHVESDRAHATTKDYFQECITVFEQANREDLVANFINGLGAILQRMQCWGELEPVARRAIALHQTYPHQFRLARAYGFLAEVALAKSAWKQAQESAQQALAILDNAASTAEKSVSSETLADLEWEQSSHQGWYLFTLAKAQIALGEKKEAIATLETAKARTKAQYDPELYIQILWELRDCYFQQGEYLKAFHIKLELRSNEQTYGIRAFIGAGRLQPKQQVTNPALVMVEQQQTVAQEIAATGREQDIKRLVERVARPDHKLTIIYGQSGVGKSSILQAGLIPVLKNRAIGTRDVVPVLQQVYPDWIRELGERLAEAIPPRRTSSQNSSPQHKQTTDAANSILNQLQTNADDELLTVLIFDQFEEFFFVYKDPKQRLTFYNFLRECLDVPHARVILSLREDYLYYLLECNDRLTNLEVINNNILDKDILYYLGNFSRKDAKALIKSFTQTTKLLLDAELIDALVDDLAGDFGEIRPIELQVVGTQLQTEKIKTLAQYQKHGPKEELVGKFLEEVVKDCGTENEQIAKLVLYLLTDENNTRPLKTRADLELELEVKAEKLDLVLLILVKSGLVFKIPAVPAARYQLVHDYLVPFVRQQQSERLIAELEKEREQRKLTEAKLNEVLRQQLLESRRGLVWKVSLGVLAGAFAIFLPLVLNYQNNLQLISMSTEAKGLLKSNQDLEALVKTLKAGKRLQQWWSIGVEPETRMRVETALQDVVYTIRERNSLEGYTDSVTSVSFSPNGQIVVSGTADGTIKLWSRDGREIKTFKAHDKKIISISFSPDSQKFVSGSEDNTPKLWSLDGKEIKTFEGHEDSITSVSFNSNGQMVVSGSKDRTIKLWNLDGKEIKTFNKHRGSINSVSFSPNGKLIASASEDKTIKLWNLEGQEVKTMNHDQSVKSIGFSSDGQTIVALSGYYSNPFRLWRRDGTLLTARDISIMSGNTGYTPDLISLSLDGRTMALGSANEKSIQIQSLKLQDSSDIGNILNLQGHRNNITGISFSPDGKVLASASEDKTVKLWNVENQNFQTPNLNYVTNVSFSPNGQILVSVKSEQKVQLWQRNGILMTTLPGNNSKVIFSANTQTLASASQDNTVQLWRRDGTFFKTLQGEVVNGSFSPDGRTIALVRSDNSVDLLASDGKAIATLKGHKDSIYEINFSRDGQTIATASKDKTIKLWRRDGTRLNDLKGYDENNRNTVFRRYQQDAKSISLSPNGETLAILGADNTVKFLRRDGKLIKTIKSDREISVNFSPDGEIVAIGKEYSASTKNVVELWRIDGTFLKTLQPQGESSNIGVVGFTPDSQTIVTIGDSNKMQFWRRDGSLLSTFDGKTISRFSPDFQILVSVEGFDKIKLWKGDGTPIRTIQVKTERADLDNPRRELKFAFSPDGKTLAIPTNEDTVELWRIDGTFLKILPRVQNKEIERFSNFDIEQHISFSSDSQTLATRTGENKVQVWKIDGNASTKASSPKIIQARGDWVGQVKFIPNTDKVAIVGGDDTVKLWQLAHQPGKEPQLLKTFQGHSNLVTSVSISPNGETIASASNDKTVKLWRRDGKLLNTFTGHTDKVNSISFSPDGQLLASASDDKTVKVWRPDGTVIKTFKEHGNGVTTVSFSPNGDTIASASYDNTVKIWSLNGKESKSITTLNSDEPVTSVSFSPNRKLIASASATKVKLWSIDSKLLTTFERFGSNDVSFSPDGKSIAAGGENGVSVWNFDLNELLKRGCDAARDYLKNNSKAKNDRTLCDNIK
ncbi:hypothetical protein SD80_004360 [Scytonema tolypothrichoides VB-61278]|nr:hypothetical protein SD80_004360 [Scytonema tolypothrichoides VB-61278]